MEAKIDFEDLKIFSTQFKLGEQLGEGAFGAVVKATHLQTGNEVAVKFETNGSTLKHEYRIYELMRIRDQSLFQENPIPSIYGFGKIGEISWLGMDLLGPTIEQLFLKCGGFRKETIISIGIEILECLNFLHRCGIVHNDVKADNFAISANNPKKIVMFDFGLACNNQSTPGGFRGTLYYASIAAHECRTVSPKNDIESLGYLLADMHKPLPWTNVVWPGSFEQKVQFGLKLKREKNIFALSTGFFELTLYFMHVGAKKNPTVHI